MKEEIKKIWYVYKLVNSEGIIEHIGESTRPNVRFYQHVKYKPNNDHGHGRFYGREDLKLEIIKEFDNKKEAYNYQCELQIELGFISDKQKSSIGIQKSYDSNPDIKNKISKGVKETHINNPNIGERISKNLKITINKPEYLKKMSERSLRITKCEYCGKEGKFIGMIKNHFERCKFKP